MFKSRRQGKTFPGASIVLLAMFLASCGSGGGGAAPPPTQGNESVAARVLASAPLSACPYGGITVQTGIDKNGNGVLDPNEVTNTQYVCNGTPGKNGAAGPDSLVSMVSEPAGTNCPAGGTKVNAGLDLNGNGVLDPSEITSISYVCNGPAGAHGAPGAAGLNSLITITAVAAGSNCPYGGEEIQSGLDANRNGALYPSEVSATAYVCNGAPPPAGAETLGQKLRRVATTAQGGNPLIDRPLTLQSNWLPGTLYSTGQIVTNGGNLYLAVNGGISNASGGPTGTGMARIADGSVTWSYFGAPSISANDPAAPALTVTTSPDARLTAIVPGLIGGTVQNSAAFQLGSNGVATSSTPFLAVSVGPKVAVPIASVSGSGSTVTVTTAVAHNYYTGLPIVASGFSPSAFDAAGGTPITVVDASTYTYAASGPVSGAPGVIGSVNVWKYGNSGATQDWFGSGYLQLEEDGQVTFNTDAPLLSVGMSGSARIAIDGRYIDLGVQPSVGSPSYFNVDFSAVGGRRIRQIRVEGVLAPALIGVYVAPGDQVYAPPEADVVKVQFVGDSFFNANDATPLTIADDVGLRLGWLNAIASNNGGSGFVSSNPAPPNYSLNYLDRIADVKAIAPDVLVYVTSGNDNASGYGAVLSNALACLKQARAWFPNLPIIVLELQSWRETAGSIASSGTTVTVTVPSGHGFSTGEFVTMANISPAGYNGTYRITVTGPNTFTYVVPAALPASSTTLFFASRPAAAARNAVAQLQDPMTWFVPTISDPAGSWFTGSGNVASPIGDGNADFYVSPDGVHPEVRGVDYLAVRISQSIANILPLIP